MRAVPAFALVCAGVTRAGVLSERTAGCMREAAVPVVCRGLLVVAGVCAELCTGVEVFAAFAFAVRLIIVGEDGVCAASIVLSRAGTFATEALAADEVGGTTLT